jgi:hypothetical protein
MVTMKQREVAGADFVAFVLSRRLPNVRVGALVAALPE